MMKYLGICLFLSVSLLGFGETVFDFDKYSTPGSDPFETMSKLVELVRDICV